MEYTQNYALRKPGLNEYANVGDLNFNADKIDSQMKKNQDVDGEVYDPTSTSANAYEAGDYVINPDDGLMYVCNGTTYGTWDATKWDHTTEFEELQKAMASGGESELANLHDVDITNPTEGQVLTYDDQNDEWVNSDLPDADVTKTASGNPIEFSDGANAPLVKCITQITGSQDLHGYDKPWVGGAGKNKLDLVSITPSKQEQGITFTVNSDGTILANGTATGQCQIVFNIAQSVAQTFANLLFTRGSNVPVGLTYAFELNGSPYTQYLMSGGTISSSIASASTSINFIIRIQSGTVLSNVLFKPMLRASGTTDNFEPYSNICPITAYTEGEIEVRGKNLVDDDNMTMGLPGYQQGQTIDDVTTSTRYAFSAPIKVTSDNVTVSAKTESTAYFTDVLIICYDENGNYLSTTQLRLPNVGQLYTADTITPSDGAWIRVVAGADASHQISTSIQGEIQAEKGSTATTYEPYTSTTHTTTYPSAIYRGSEDVVNGIVEADKVKLVFDGTETWYSDARWPGLYYTINFISNFPTPVSGGYGTDCLSNMYVGAVKGSLIQYVTGEFAFCHATITSTASSILFMTNYSTVEEFKASISGGLEVVVPLGTPTTETIIPTNLPIKSLFGYNHIESSTGEMEVEYFPAKEQPLIDLIPEASNMHEYSTAEHAVGTWIDGETIYERSIDLGSFSIGSGGTYIIEEATDIDLLIDYDGYVIESSIMYALPDPSIRIKMESNKDLIFSGTASWSVTSGYLTIRYTKTSSNNRSLAKSAPQEEIKEEQVEELKEEPTEEVKEEPTEETKEEPVEEVKEEETKEEGEVNER